MANGFTIDHNFLLTSKKKNKSIIGKARLRLRLTLDEINTQSQAITPTYDDAVLKAPSKWKNKDTELRSSSFVTIDEDDVEDSGSDSPGNTLLDLAVDPTPIMSDTKKEVRGKSPSKRGREKVSPQIGLSSAATNGGLGSAVEPQSQESLVVGEIGGSVAEATVSGQERVKHRKSIPKLTTTISAAGLGAMLTGGDAKKSVRINEVPETVDGPQKSPRKGSVDSDKKKPAGHASSL